MLTIFLLLSRSSGRRFVVQFFIRFIFLFYFSLFSFIPTPTFDMEPKLFPVAINGRFFRYKKLL